MEHKVLIANTPGLVQRQTMPSFLRFLPPVLTGLWLSVIMVPAAASEKKDDLLIAARQWAVESGKAVARDRLEKAMIEQDDGRNFFERRIWKVNENKDYAYPDAASHLTESQRSRTGVYFVLGYQKDQGDSPPIIRAVAEELRRQGFHAVAIETEERKSADESALEIAALLSEDLKKVDRAMLIGFSKGAYDIVRFLTGPAEHLPAHDQKKLRLLVNFSGVLRGSCVADWAAHDHYIGAYAFRAYLNIRSGSLLRNFDDVSSIADDPWQNPSMPSLREHAPNLKYVINYPALPEGKDGFTHKDWLFHRLARSCECKKRIPGPYDGLVESAASILPPDVEVPQWIVRVRGSHSLLDGEYLNGGTVAPSYYKGEKGRVHSGIELMDDMLRALPKSALGW
ncbi:hypothetical protein BH11VER1_BH11VER1_38000 [soil metagenome]